MKDGKNKSKKRIVNLINFIVDHLQQLVYLRIYFSNMLRNDTPYFPHLVRWQLYQYPLRGLCLLRCSTENIQTLLALNDILHKLWFLEFFWDMFWNKLKESITNNEIFSLNLWQLHKKITRALEKVIYLSYCICKRLL